MYMYTQAPEKSSAPLGVTHESGMALDRKCDCGGHAGLTGACAQCSRSNLLKRRAVGDDVKSTSKSEGALSLFSDSPHDVSARKSTGIHVGHDFGSLHVHFNSLTETFGRSDNPASAQRDVFTIENGGHNLPGAVLKEEIIDWGGLSSDESGRTELGGNDTLPADGGTQTPATLPGVQTGGTNCDAGTGATTTNVTNNEPCTRDCSASHEQKHASDIGPCCTKAGAAAKKAEKQEDKDRIQSQFDNWMLSNVNFLECRAYGVSVTCAETKHNKLKCPESVYNNKCCGPVARYLRSSRMQKESTCNNAGPALTDCPFT